MLNTLANPVVLGLLAAMAMAYIALYVVAENPDINRGKPVLIATCAMQVGVFLIVYGALSLLGL